jgi:hypothetical protein
MFANGLMCEASNCAQGCDRRTCAQMNNAIRCFLRVVTRCMLALVLLGKASSSWIPHRLSTACIACMVLQEFVQQQHAYAYAKLGMQATTGSTLLL